MNSAKSKKRKPPPSTPDACAKKRRKVTPFSLAKTKSHPKSLWKSATPQTKTKKRANANAASADSGALSKAPNSSKKEVKKRKRVNAKEKAKKIKEYNDKYSRFANGKDAVEVGLFGGSNRERMRCNVCIRFPDIADTGFIKSTTRCAMATKQGIIYMMDRMIIHYEGSEKDQSHKRVVDHIKAKLADKAARDALIAGKLVNDTALQEEKTHTLVDYFHVIEQHDKLSIYRSVLEIMTEEFIAAKSLSLSSPSVQKLHLADSYVDHCNGLKGKEWIPFEAKESDLIYNNNTSRRRVLKYLSQWVSETWVKPKLLQCKALTHGCDGWRMKIEWYIHGARVVISTGDVEYVFLGMIEPHGRGAEGAFETIAKAYEFHEVEWVDIEPKIAQFLFDRARINIGHVSGVIARARQKMKRKDMPLLTCHNHDTMNGFKAEIFGDAAPKVIKSSVNLIRDWCVFINAGERQCDYEESAALCLKELEELPKDDPIAAFLKASVTRAGSISTTRMANHFFAPAEKLLYQLIDDRDWYDNYFKALTHRPTLLATGFIIDLAELWKHVDIILQDNNSDVTTINTASDIFIESVCALTKGPGIFERIIESLIVDTNDTDSSKRYKLWKWSLHTKRQRSLRCNRTTRKWSDVRYSVLIRQRAQFRKRIADSPVAPLIPSVIPKNWRLSVLPHTVLMDNMGKDSVQQFCKMYAMEFEETWRNMKRFKIYIVNEHDVNTAPSTLAQTVKILSDIQHKHGLALCYDLYCRLLSAVNHGMWLEVWNSMAGIATGGKMHEKHANTVSWKLNIKINAPILSSVDLRVPAAGYTVKIARRPKTKGKGPEQYQYKDIFAASHAKYKSDNHNKKRKDGRKLAADFFNLTL